MNIGKSVKIGLVKYGVQQKQLAEHLQITPGNVYQITKKTTNVNGNRIQQLADFFGVSCSEFIAWGE